MNAVTETANILQHKIINFPFMWGVHTNQELWYILTCRKHLRCLLQDVGFEGEIGYQTFLYSNVESVRRLFMFLIEKLPRDGAEAADEPAGEDSYDIDLSAWLSFVCAPFEVFSCM